MILDKTEFKNTEIDVSRFIISHTVITIFDRMSISLKLPELASTEKPSEIPETRNVLIQSYSRSNSGRPFDFTSSEILTWNTVFPGSSSEFRFLPEGIREVRIPGTPGRNFLFSSWFDVAPSFLALYHCTTDIPVMESG